MDHIHIHHNLHSKEEHIYTVRITTRKSQLNFLMNVMGLMDYPWNTRQPTHHISASAVRFTAFLPTATTTIQYRNNGLRLRVDIVPNVPIKIIKKHFRPRKLISASTFNAGLRFSFETKRCRQWSCWITMGEQVWRTIVLQCEWTVGNYRLWCFTLTYSVPSMIKLLSKQIQMSNFSYFIIFEAEEWMSVS